MLVQGKDLEGVWSSGLLKKPHLCGVVENPDMQVASSAGEICFLSEVLREGKSWAMLDQEPPKSVRALWRSLNGTPGNKLLSFAEGEFSHTVPGRSRDHFQGYLVN